MKSSADISLRWQVLLAPLLLILAILVIEAVNYRQQTGVDAATTRLFDETVRRLTALDEADAFALEINSRMFRAMKLVQARLLRPHPLEFRPPGDSHATRQA